LTSKRQEDYPLPANVDAEKVILGAILLDSAYYRKVVGKLEPQDFSLDSHRIIFNAMQELDKEGSAIQLVLLVERLRATQMLANISTTPVAYLASLTEGLPWHPSLKDYLRIVREKRKLRTLIQLCSDASSAAWSQTEPAADIAERLSLLLEGLQYGKQKCDITPNGNAELGGAEG